MKFIYHPFIYILMLSVFVSCKKNSNQKTVESSRPYHQLWEKADAYYLQNIDEALVWLDSLHKVGLGTQQTKTLFQNVRNSFKKAEAYAGVLNPETTHRANGPALPFYKDDSGKVIQAMGLQKLEETIYADEIHKADFEREIYFQKGFFENLRYSINERELNAQRFFIGTHQQIMRLVSLAMVGFDTPTTGTSIQESVLSLKSLEDVYVLSIQSIIQQKDKKLDSIFVENIKDAIDFIHQDSDFETFDRYTFIKDYLNPITRNWVAIRQTSELWESNSKYYPYNFNAPTFFEEDSFNVNHFLAANDKNPTKERIALGQKLFFDKNLSSKGNMACATCHLPSKAYSDGLALGKDNMGHELERNSPTLINSIYQKAFFWDGRATNIESQINSVFTNKKEFDSQVHQFSGNILKDTTYYSLFKEAYGVVPKKNKEVVRALSVYVSTLKGFSSKFDKNIRGEENTFTPSEKKGFNLFMGKALCATCHFMPLTNGTVPPFFSETEKEIIGVPKTGKNKELDEDKGFYWVFEEEIHNGMFKTPTLRNIALTAPYMHNGVYNTLEEVMDFYNKGGGAGLGFDVPHQTLPFDNLDLSEQEIKDIITFMKTLTDVPQEMY
ncbi:cytochrome-c peroxidase [Wenyingzhuangia sp. 2_MG-2023]|uniref:cytochrome-c peroxidase n=1 Tax=Wenyingzhuangia sp. 2_MG-2023 TaxID=3062639 RepID=UPI0026E35A39|nr:cytochrome c peroxidase [Wenyingzhuangia sp. 2_MG-2023]MDO6738280.1 cytochrome c peroxidase [Wenyingzhuangia sp. 2_MG-2023]